jgi:3-phenylpropionate/trans-cinnamate dioxygenase ferredoxin subunit
MVSEASLKQVRVCSVKEIELGSGKSFTMGELQIAVYNSGGKYYASQLHCSHAEEELHEGWLEGDTIECPRHGAQFCLRTGEALSLPATDPIEVFEVKTDGGELYVLLPEKYVTA